MGAILIGVLFLPLSGLLAHSLLFLLTLVGIPTTSIVFAALLALTFAVIRKIKTALVVGMTVGASYRSGTTLWPVWMVFCQVITVARSKLKVLWSIIITNSIEMMHALLRSKRPANQLLHDNIMFKPQSSIESTTHVPSFGFIKHLPLALLIALSMMAAHMSSLFSHDN